MIEKVVVRGRAGTVVREAARKGTDADGGTGGMIVTYAIAAIWLFVRPPYCGSMPRAAPRIGPAMAGALIPSQQNKPRRARLCVPISYTIVAIILGRLHARLW